MIRFTGQKHVVYHMDFFPDSSYLVTVGGSSAAIWFWDLKNPKKAEKFQLPKLNPPEKYDYLGELVVSNEGEIVIVVTIDTNYQSLDHPRFQTSLHSISWPSKVIKVFPFDSSRRALGIDAVKQRTHLITSRHPLRWTPFGSEPKWEFLDFALDTRVSLYWSDGLEWFAHVRDYEIRTFNLPTKTLSNPRRVTHHSARVEFSPSAKYFVLYDGQTSFQVFETSTVQPIGDEIKISSCFVAPQFTPDDKKLLIAGINTLHIFDTHTSEELACYDFKIGDITAMKISDDGLMYTVSGTNKEIVVADLEA